MTAASDVSGRVEAVMSQAEKIQQEQLQADSEAMAQDLDDTKADVEAGG